MTRNEAFILRLLQPFVNSYWVNVKAIRKRLVEQESIDSKRIEVIYNGFKFSNTSHADAIPPFGAITQSKIVVNVSNLREVKGVDNYIRAARIVVNNDDE